VLVEALLQSFHAQQRQRLALWRQGQKQLGKHEQKREKDAAFDLLDALTRGCTLAIPNAALHVLVAATHCFDETLLETVVRGGANPIDKVECSTLILGMTVHQRSASELLQDGLQARVAAPGF